LDLYLPSQQIKKQLHHVSQNNYDFTSNYRITEEISGKYT